MTIRRFADYPYPNNIEDIDSVADYLKKLHSSLQNESTERIMDFDILRLTNVPWVDVRAYGAKGDGTTDDTTVINSAGSTNKPLFFPPGTYKITSDVTMSGALGIRGDAPHLELNDSAKIILSGGDDLFLSPFLNLKIEIKSNNATGIEIKRRRINVNGVYLLGTGEANGQKGFYFDIDTSPQVFHYFEDFYIFDVAYPVYITGSTYWFNANKIGEVGTSFIEDFIDGITIDTDDHFKVEGNEFGGYFQDGTNIIYFKKNTKCNVFKIYRDNISGDLIKTDVTVDGNIYYLYDKTHYSQSGAGYSYSDTIYPWTRHQSISKTFADSGYQLKFYDRLCKVDASGGNTTITLPTKAEGKGLSFTIVKTDSSANTVTVDTPGAETINGASSVTLSSQWDRLTVMSDGINYYRID